jgi:GNAT superfamily N-acetyltransferase
MTTMLKSNLIGSANLSPHGFEEPKFLDRRARADNRGPDRACRGTTAWNRWGSLTLRPIESMMADLFLQHLERLDDASRLSRFGMVADDAFLRTHTERAIGERCLSIGCFEGGDLRGVAELHDLGPGRWQILELALSVEPPFQSQGIGKALARRAVTTARELDAGEIHTCFNVANHRMKAIAQGLPMTLDYDWPFVTGTQVLRRTGG